MKPHLYLFLPLLSMAITVCADEFVRSVEPKMTYAEVLAIKGAPKSKETKESKRHDIWHYEKETIVFSQGIVLERKSLEDPKKQGITPQPVIAKGADPAAKEKSAEEAEMILKDLVGSD